MLRMYVSYICRRWKREMILIADSFPFRDGMDSFGRTKLRPMLFSNNAYNIVKKCTKLERNFSGKLKT